MHLCPPWKVGVRQGDRSIYSRRGGDGRYDAGRPQEGSYVPMRTFSVTEQEPRYDPRELPSFEGFTKDGWRNRSHVR
jgi:hypothetical protein